MNVVLEPYKNLEMEHSRRGLLRLTAGGLAFITGVGATSSSTYASSGLKDVALARGIEIGSAFNGWFHKPLLRLLIENCDVITPENAMKAANISADDGRTLTPGVMDDIATFCSKNRMRIHGHTLFWHQSLPNWLQTSDFKQTKKAYLQHLRFVMTRYPQATSWDVVNEVMSDQKRPYRALPVLDTHGDAFVGFLFETARELAPKANLVINDYNLACGTEFCDEKRGRLVTSLERLLRAGIPIDAVGIQAHLAPRWPVVSTSLQAFLTDIGDLGVDVFITELDVNDIDLPDDVSARDQSVAQIYADFLEAALENQVVKRVSFWGLTDKFHWIVEGYAPFSRSGSPPRPALFDQDLQPKPSYFAVRDALSRAPKRESSRLPR
ncbi:MAG: endo-1,4-beta-xylanase [Roseibium sp.]